MSNNSSTNNVLPAPQVKGMLAGSPMESAYLAGKQNNQLVSSLSKVGGKRRMMRMKYKGGAAGATVVVPTLPVAYNDQMAGSQSVTGQTVSNASTILQADANSKYDKVTLVNPSTVNNKIGGRRKSRRTRKSRKTRKSKKSRKTRK
jgi:hypothetical protein